MSIDVSVIVCTHNPRRDHLAATLASLQAQTAIADPQWELIVVDNASTIPLEGRTDLSWSPRARIVREDRLGLTHARLRSFHEASGEVLVYVDDDNVLHPDYLRLAHAAMVADPTLGAAGGKSIPRYERPPPAWFDGLGISLACQDFGEIPLYASWSGVAAGERRYPACAPVGAGMVLRKVAYAAYVSAAEGDAGRTALGRTGSDLAAGEDNDIVMSLLAAGWRVAYLPQLSLQHLISANRLTRSYLARHAYGSNKSWVRVLDVHGIRPWPAMPRWSSPLRKARAFAGMAAWRGNAEYVRWRSACGLFDGRASLSERTHP